MTRTAFIPFYSMEKAPDRFSLTLPWPVGVTRTVDHQKDYREWGIPWPIITWARGDDKRATRLWPLFGSQNSPKQQKGFVAWPLLRFQNKRDTVSVKHSQQILFTSTSTWKKPSDPMMRSCVSAGAFGLCSSKREKMKSPASNGWLPWKPSCGTRRPFNATTHPSGPFGVLKKTRYLVGMSGPSYGMSGARIDHRKEMSPLYSSDCLNTKNPHPRAIGPSSDAP